jgi:hypothetical protein
MIASRRIWLLSLLAALAKELLFVARATAPKSRRFVLTGRQADSLNV